VNNRAPKQTGEVKFSIIQDKGNIKLDFSRPVHWLLLTPGQARKMGQMLINNAKQIISRKSN